MCRPYRNDDEKTINLKSVGGGGSWGGGDNNNDGQHGAATDAGLWCDDVGRRVRSRGILGSRRGEHGNALLPTANPRITIPWGLIVAQREGLMPSTAVRGGESLTTTTTRKPQPNF
jgi:hypothetical protein